jgi:hypothetical protein
MTDGEAAASRRPNALADIGATHSQQRRVMAMPFFRNRPGQCARDETQP